MKNIYLLSLFNFLAINAAFEQDLTQFINNYMQRHRIPGLSIAIVHDQEIIYARGFGWADRKRNLRATPHTVYRMGSISKVFTATAIMQLAEKNLINIDDPIRAYIPFFLIRSPLGPHKPITLRQLLTHYGGLPHRIVSPLKKRAPYRYQSLEDMVRALKHMSLINIPGTTYAYSNAGFTVLGHIVERVSGQGYVQYMNQHILWPLQMNTASFAPLRIPERIKKRMAQGHRNGKPFDQPPIWGTAAGGLVATVLDMSNFIKMLINNGSFAGQQILESETLQEMWTPQNKAVRQITKGPLQGLGWILTKRGLPVEKVVWHTGKTQGFTNDLIILPEQKLGVIVSTNARGKNIKLGPISKKALLLALRKYAKLPLTTKNNNQFLNRSGS